MFRLHRKLSSGNLLTPRLFDQDGFYPAFIRDLHACTKEVVIECPFITSRRMAQLLPVFRKVRSRNVSVVINTRDPIEHEGVYREQAIEAINHLQSLGILVLYTGGHHRKLAILDRTVTWMGSLNILSYSDSCEIMTRTTSKALAEQMIHFLHLGKYLKKDWHERF